MALNLLTNPSSTPTSATEWTNLLSREDVAAIGGGVGMGVFTLTERSTTARPEIAQGSIVEVGGSWYQADSDTALTDDSGLADGTVHIKLVPGAGTPDPATVIPTLTSDALPAWDAEKGGWYDSDDKFLPYEMERSGAVTKVYTAKCELVNQDKTVKICNDGSVGLDGSLDVGGNTTVDGGLSVVGAISADSVTSGTSPLKWKTFTGTTDGSGDASFSHGLDASKIYGISAVIYTGSTNRVLLGSQISYDGATSIVLDAGFINSPFRVITFYS